MYTQTHTKKDFFRYLKKLLLVFLVGEDDCERCAIHEQGKVRVSVGVGQLVLVQAHALPEAHTEQYD